jgi:hypothetical protein
MYKLIKNIFTGEINSVNKTDGNILISIPFADDNTDYQAYLKWVAEGGVPTPADK